MMMYVKVVFKEVNVFVIVTVGPTPLVIVTVPGRVTVKYLSLKENPLMILSTVRVRYVNVRKSSVIVVTLVGMRVNPYSRYVMVRASVAVLVTTTETVTVTGPLTFLVTVTGVLGPRVTVTGLSKVRTWVLTPGLKTTLLRV